MSNFLQTFSEIIKILHSENIAYMVVGSLASMSYGEPRLTKDMDMVLSCDPGIGLKLAKLFSPPDYYLPPQEIMGQEIVNRRQFNLLHIPTGLKVDFIIQKADAFAAHEFERRVTVSLLPNFDVMMATPEDVIVKKLAYFQEGRSSKHISDIRGILAHTEVDREYIEHWTNLLNLQAEWQSCLV